MRPTDQTQAAKRFRALLRELEYRRRTNRIQSYFQETGPLRRELYAKHMAAFAAGARRKVRVIQAANRVGKTEGLGGVELTYHLTGEYPDWWEGKRFNKPITAVCAGVTKETTRDIIQKKLMGEVGDFGTGLIPKRCVGRFRFRQNSNNAVEWMKVHHKSGGWSKIMLKSFEQGREAFEGIEADVVWLDEECPIDIYEECILRLTTTGGIALLTYTPLKGVTKLIKSLRSMALAGEADASELAPVFITITWDDAPHLTAEMKQAVLATTPPHTHMARMMGVPILGEGAIYPVTRDQIECKPFSIPKHWPRAYGMDVGWNRTAAVWGAWDKESDTVYLYAEHYVAHAQPEIHAAGIKLRGDWIPGVIDKAARATSATNGTDLLSIYRALGLKLYPTDISNTAEQNVEAGLMAVLSRLSMGRLKVFSTLQSWFAEYEGYHRKEGKVVKDDDHLMDATRYLIVWGLPRAKVFVPTQSVPIMGEQTFGLYN